MKEVVDFVKSLQVAPFRYEPYYEKPAFCVVKNKGTNQVQINHSADQCLCFVFKAGTILYFLNVKCQAS